MTEGTITKRELHLIFEDSQKERTTVVISMPKAEVTKEEVDAVGALLIEKNVLCSRKGAPFTTFKNAQVVMTKVATL